MIKKRRFLAAFAAVVFVLSFTGMAAASQVADVSVGAFGIHLQPRVNYDKMILAVSCPDGQVFHKTFASGSAPYLGLSDNGGKFIDGIYNYELRVIPNVEKRARNAGETRVPQKAMLQSGAFTVQGGSILSRTAAETTPDRPQDVLHYDDVIITGSLCVGFDCANGEAFGYDTVKLKENNLRLYFEDTSIGTFPSGDWRIRINDTTSGGASYFAVEDATNGRTPFKIETGAPSNSLYVEDYGRVGLGTSIPYVELHIVDGDSPTIRLDQDGSSGWTAQRWDLCGNETNFFIRDVTNGSKLCFRIQPNTPSSTLCLKADGKVGIGTWSPAYAMELEKTGEDAVFGIDRTDGATGKVAAGTNGVQIGAVSNHKVHFVVNNATKVLTVDIDGDVGIGQSAPTYPLHMASGARCTVGGVWTDASSREYKENITELNLNEAMDALQDLNPVKYNYKTDKEENCLGFIAEDVPELVSSKDRKGMAPMDVVAVLTKVVQEQQKTIDELKKEVSELKKK
ncbi:MAG: tail fiber domain-containing protein [Candidatus Aminicenantes bacterium]|nr:tail fiber domain-containing protein [Candidatus Aminicenantes bacterium]